MTNDHFDLPDAEQKTVHAAVAVERYGRTEFDYRGYRIWFDMPPLPIRTADWHFQHLDFDLDDHRYGHCATMADCMEEIDAQIEEDADDAR